MDIIKYSVINNGPYGLSVDKLRGLESKRVVVLLDNEGDFVTKDKTDYIRSLLPKAIMIASKNNIEDRESVDINIEFFRISHYLQTRYDGQKVNDVVSLNGKGLFLMGKPEKVHRLPFLNKLVQSETNLLYSFPKSVYLCNDDFVERTIRSLLHLQPREETIRQLNTLSNDFLDDAKFSVSSKTSPHSSGYPYSTELYAQTGFSIISETHAPCHHLNVIHHTEKTWRTIANRHPFVLLAPRRCMEDLKKQGFCTYDDFCPVRYWENSNTIYDDAIQVIKHWNQYQDKRMLDAIEHNFQLYTNLVHREYRELVSILDTATIMQLGRLYNYGGVSRNKI